MANAFVEHCLELLSPLGAVRSRRMFGGHGLYAGERFVALIAFDRLYVKADAESEPRFAAAGCVPFLYEGKGKPVRMSYWTVPDEAMESPAAMAPWAQLAWQAAGRAAAAKAAAPAKAPAGATARTRQARPKKPGATGRA
jgi:DNA transformation protein